jgi:hypothetical protein
MDGPKGETENMRRSSSKRRPQIGSCNGSAQPSRSATFLQMILQTPYPGVYRSSFCHLAVVGGQDRPCQDNASFTRLILHCRQRKQDMSVQPAQPTDDACTGKDLSSRAVTYLARAVLDRNDANRLECSIIIVGVALSVKESTTGITSTNNNKQSIRFSSHSNRHHRFLASSALCSSRYYYHHKFDSTPLFPPPPPDNGDPQLQYSIMPG